MFRRSIPLLCSVALVACDVVGPDYTPPSIDLSHQFVGGGTRPLTNAASNKWWQRLNDPMLNELVERGSVQNIGIQTALERITQAQEAISTTGPNSQFNGNFGASLTRSGVRDAGPVTNSNARQLDGNYVLDLFGGSARDRERAEANFDSSQVSAGTVRLAFLTDLTSSYVSARYFQQAAAINRQTIRSRRETLNLVHQRRDAGEATELEVQQARSQLAQAEAGLPVTVANFETSVFRIATLLAEPAGPIMAKMRHGSSQPRPSGFTGIGLPADLLRNRPDVQVAERNLAAATASIGVAEAQLFPSVSLGGSVGVGTTDRFSFGPSLNLPLFSRGVIRANRNVAVSAARQAELNWRQTVLTAVEEVQSSLTLCVNWQRQLRSLEMASRASSTVMRLSRESYEGGAITLTDVLDAERQNANTHLAVADALRNYTLNWMRVQVTTGQGWLTAPSATALETLEPMIPQGDPLGLTPDPLEARLKN